MAVDGPMHVVGGGPREEHAGAAPRPRVTPRSAATGMLRLLREARNEARFAIDQLPETCRPAAEAQTLDSLDRAMQRARRLVAMLDGEESEPLRNAA